MSDSRMNTEGFWAKLDQVVAERDAALAEVERLQERLGMIGIWRSDDEWIQRAVRFQTEEWDGTRICSTCGGDMNEACPDCHPNAPWRTAATS